MFRAIVFTSVLVGVIVGFAVTAVQHFGTGPLIMKAEVYENVGDPHRPDHEAMAAQDHSDAGWKPTNVVERNAFTLVANILTAIGYALVLTGLIAMRGKPVTWREGLLWGLAGFASVMLAPMLGLVPELPGTPAAPLADRQIWWVGTVVATAAGVGLIVFQRNPWGAIAAIALIAAPHLVGAPTAPEGEHALAPASLEREFVTVAVLTSLFFWGLLGSLSGTVFRRFEV